MLLQIGEPGESTHKAACAKRVVGIDLGTTHSLVAFVSDGHPSCIPDASGDMLLPSVVHYPGGTTAPLVGKAAVSCAVQRPQDTIFSVKRLMGKSVEDISIDVLRQYRVDVKKSAQVIHLNVEQDDSASARTVTPVQVSAEILRTLKARAETFLGGAIDGAVITVPAYFDEAQRQATKDAGRLAGLPVLRLVNEPTAAALAYGLQHRATGRFAVYDLGGGTFDVSILTLHEGVFTVLATAGDTSLGGDDMDHVCAQILIENHPQASRLKVLWETDPSVQRLLLSIAKEVKHTLSQQEDVSAIQVGDFPGHTFISRKQFERDITPILDRTSVACRRAMRDAELEPKDVSGVILVGGATRVPAVRQHVARLFQTEPRCDIDPDQVVALGAAVQAEVIANGRADVLLIDVNPLSLGLVLMGDVVEKIIPRNSRIPTIAKQVFTTYADGQTGFDLHIVQGERETVLGCRSLARFQLTGIPPLAAGMARLEVTFLMDENGLLHVTAKELVSGKETHVEVKPSYGLTDQQVEQMLLDSYEHAVEDLTQRFLQEQRVEAERVLLALRKALSEDGSLLHPSEAALIADSISTLELSMKGSNPTVIKERIAALDEHSRRFVELRVSQKMQAVIAGKSIDDIE